MAIIDAAPNPPESPPSFLKRLALNRPELRAWAMYDWANSAVVTVVMTAVFPVYFQSVVGEHLPEGEATGRLAMATTIALVIVAVLAPLLGALADSRAIRKRCLGIFAGIGILATIALFSVDSGEVLWALSLFVLINIGAAGSFVFYDALLPGIASGDEMDRVSTAGYALGYIGGGLLLGLGLAWIESPQWFGLPSGEGLSADQATLPVRLALLAAGLWWALFSIPLFLRVPEADAVAIAEGEDQSKPIRSSIIRLKQTFSHLGAHRQAFLFMVAFLIFNDGIMTIYRMAPIFAADRGISQGAIMGAVLLAQFIGIPFAFLFGQLASLISSKRAIAIGLVFYTGITFVGYSMREDWHFLALGASVGMVQGGCQALSRSLFASMIPRHRSGEFFALFAVGEKFAGILGPGMFAVLTFTTGSSDLAILGLSVFFLIGLAILSRVDVDAGRQRAREAEMLVAQES